MFNPHQQSHLTVEAAQTLLQDFNCTDGKLVTSESEKTLIRQAVLVVSRFSDYQILGICADTATQGIAALASYAKALGYQPNLDLTLINNSVYIKFNPVTGLCYLNPYSGEHRGVLVSCQSPESGGINEMYGHLPLDLFE
ncbi:DUF1824 family protein [Gloeocapsopsis dulcis]|uniref:DUF1824 domain-containing protein n=1 Tax=Gloeocapsopsis dulcis AAB1 = 1H9 TaxID=1433147 RepID=A0A6N8FV47_9CHRO|nr:DUF1824 family protein [Gloeocapsopsis dulcis]MUL35826.1 hypothetical protein [Gloeocapsopsis dulcis AAB1 = 1H9]WNN87708.1 DUF1824 family protein [Gloeocapsopsis dulcis]